MQQLKRLLLVILVMVPLSVADHGHAEGNTVTTDNAPNLVANGSFEDGGSDWRLSGGAAVVESDAAEGRSTLLVTGQGAAEQIVTGLQPNTSYHLTGSGKASGSATLAAHCP